MQYEHFVFSYLDLFIGPLYLFLVYTWAKNYQRKKAPTYDAYNWYTKGLMAKCIGGVLVCIVYQFYYKGGDTVNYGYTAQCLLNVLLKNPIGYLRLLFGEHTWETFTMFDYDTGLPMYWKDLPGFLACRIFSVFAIFSFGSYLGTTVLLTTISYVGIWRLFLLFNYIFPKMEKEFAISILYFPSLVFWGSGMLKDNVTLAATGLFTAHFYSFLVQKKYTAKNLAYLSISIFLLSAIKPYILFALIPGAILWLSNEQLSRIKNSLLRGLFAPFVFALSLGLGYLLLMQLGDNLGDYSLENVLVKAVVSNQDQKQDYYGGNSFDIGDFDPTLEGISKKAHLAVFATLYRPMLYEAKNPLMLISALENTYLLFLTLYLIFKLRIFGFFRVIGERPLLVFSLLFALFFAFSVGIATSNFGTLVRLKIPGIPFFASSLFAIRHLYEEKTNKKLRF